MLTRPLPTRALPMPSTSWAKPPCLAISARAGGRIRRGAAVVALTAATLLPSGWAFGQRAPVVVGLALFDRADEVTLPQNVPAILRGMVCLRASAGAVPEPATGDWGTAAALSVSGPGGQPASWTPVPVERPGSDFVLSAAVDGCAEYTWVLPASGAPPAPGEYLLRLELALAPPAPSASSAPLKVHVVPPSPQPPATEQVDRLLRQADVEHLQGLHAAAEATLRQALGLGVAEPGVWLRLGELAAETGRPAAAYQRFAQAVATLPDSAWRQAEPPLPLLEARARQLRALETSTDFVVTVEPKNPRHPAAGRGTSWAFALDSIQGRTPVLVRGTEYRFALRQLPAGQPFGIFSDAEGREPYASGVAELDDVLTFRPDDGAPEVLYYGSARGAFAGARLLLRSPGEVSGVEPTDGSAAQPWVRLHVGPNPCDARATVTVSGEGSLWLMVEVLDVQGRSLRKLYADDLAATGEPLRLELPTAELPSGGYVLRASDGRREASVPFVVGH